MSPLSGEILFSVVERTYDSAKRPDLLKLEVAGPPGEDNPHRTVDYDFLPATGLLDKVVTDGRTISYGYNGLGAAPTSLTYAHSGSTLLSTSRTLNADGLVSSSADKKYSNGEFAAGLQTEYAYFCFGNLHDSHRTSSGGSSQGACLL